MVRRSRLRSLVSVGMAGAVVAAGLVTLSGSAAAADHPIRGAGSRSAIPGSYIVMLRDTASLRGKGLASTAAALAKGHRGTVGDAWTALHGFSVHMSAADAEKLAAEPDVEFVQQDQRRAGAGLKKVSGSPGGPRATAALAKPGPVTASVALADGQSSLNAIPAGVQTPVSWALDRIDQHALPLDNHYAYDDSAGQGVTAYILSTGINIAHPDFGGRAVYGPNFAEDGRANADDCHGSGTEFAGLVGGTQYGVAKKVMLVGVRMANCQNLFTDTSIMNSVNWVVANGVRPAVVHLGIDDQCVDLSSGSLVDCPPSVAQLLINLQESLFNAGFPVVGGAGDHGQDTCSKSSGAAPDAIYVGATDSNDSLAPFSDYGPCVTMFAPGAGVTTDGVSGTVTVSSTAFSAALVTGAAALFLGKPEFANAAPGTIRDELVKNRSTNGIIKNLTLNSPNLLLFTGPPGFFTIGDSLGMATRGDGKLELFGVNKEHELFSRVQQSVGSGSWGVWTKSLTRGWESVGVEPNFDGRIELSGLTPDGALWRRAQADDTNWFGWSSLSLPAGAGSVSQVVLAHNLSNRQQMFVTTSDGQAFHRAQSSPGSRTWGAWSKFSFGGKLASITAVANADGRIEVLGVDEAGRVWRAAQTSATDNTWSVFTSLGDFGVVSIAGARNADGRLELIGVDSGGNVVRRAQTAAGAVTWTGWSALPVKTLGHVSAETQVDSSGVAQLVRVVGVDNVGNIWQTVQSAVNSSGYVGWTQIDGQLRP